MVNLADVMERGQFGYDVISRLPTFEVNETQQYALYIWMLLSLNYLCFSKLIKFTVREKRCFFILLAEHQTN